MMNIKVFHFAKSFILRVGVSKKHTNSSALIRFMRVGIVASLRSWCVSTLSRYTQNMILLDQNIVTQETIILRGQMRLFLVGTPYVTRDSTLHCPSNPKYHNTSVGQNDTQKTLSKINHIYSVPHMIPYLNDDN